MSNKKKPRKIKKNKGKKQSFDVLLTKINLQIL